MTTAVSTRWTGPERRVGGRVNPVTALEERCIAIYRRRIATDLQEAT
jgi:hypothetical protein